MSDRRTKVDYSKHEIIETKAEGLLIHRFKKPVTEIESVTFINVAGVLAVTGDFGNWIFCREFHPSKKGRVSTSYWCEKLKIASTQTPYDYDAEATEKEIRERLSEAEEPLSDEEKDYYQEMLEYYVHESEEIYMMHAHGSSRPDSIEHEAVPHCKKLKFWLAAVFDAFDAMCEKMPEEKEAVTA